MRNEAQHELFVKTKTRKLFFRAAIPGAIGMLASAMYQTLDGVYVGKFLGATAFASVNLAMPFVIINFAIADLIGVGSSVPISISLGEGKKETADRIFSLSCVLIVFFGILMGLFMYILAPFFMKMMGADGEFASQAVMYLRTYAVMSPVSTMVFASDNYLRICGKIHTSMCLNIFLSVFCAVVELVFLGVFGFGIWAAAFASCLGMAITASISLLQFRKGRLALSFVRPVFSFSIVKKIFACGLPSFLNNIAGRLTSIVMNMILVRLGGQNAVSVYGVLMYADGIILPIMYGSCDSLQPAVGYNWGAGYPSRVRGIEKFCFSTSFLLCMLAFLACSFIPGFIVSSFISGEIPPYAVGAVTIFAFTYLTRWISFSTQSFMLALEKSLYATIISISMAFIFPMILLLSLEWMGLDGIWLNFPLTSLLGAILSAVILLRVRKDIMKEDNPIE
ncbi:MAG: MATE family efflux transporter [Spirochaetes bacterium]|uniref:MATE family efflux transporter n=1 Tax=Candidatus Ornithospirochaeta stercoravium TaxID=2840897 RepID=A0A9D9ND33_9SPIO|nr:MATE family efflux transporter [Candidatus Ornithospirochaeta stercoravium]